MIKPTTVFKEKYAIGCYLGLVQKKFTIFVTLQGALKKISSRKLIYGNTEV